ncbi:S8 family serine peptidase [Algihabitans sp.]|uniref:S8 family serine peptidase n=1 Tax=Algihabitans sp. TaxID=2821514 RepID=UPI003BACEDE5
MKPWLNLLAAAWIAILAVPVSDALSQPARQDSDGSRLLPERPGGPAAPQPSRPGGQPTTPPRLQPQAVPVDPTRPFTIQQIVAGCLRPGSLIVARGRNLAEGLSGDVSDRELSLVLRSGEQSITLETLRHGASEWSARIPLQADLLLDRSYRLVVVRDVRLRDAIDLGGPLRACPDASVPAVADGDSGFEILATARLQGTAVLSPLFLGSVDALVGDLVQRDLILVERLDLDGLGMVLLRLVPRDAAALPGGIGALLDDLRTAFPQVVFDFNTAFRAAAARTYAAAMIGLARPPPGCRLPAGSLELGLLDGAVDWDHPAFSGLAAPSAASFLSGDEAVGASDHGTALAALLVGQDPHSGTAGLLEGQRLHAAAALADSPQGLSTTAGRLIAALDWLGRQSADLVLMALEGEENAAVETALLAAADRGMLFVAATGNGGADSPVAFPASSRWTYAVTAVDVEGAVYARAARGPEVAFAAPGVDIWAAASDGSHKYYSGTSFALPFAAAVLALHLREFPKSERGGLAALTLRGDLQRRLAQNALDLGSPGRDEIFGWGLVQAAAC